jgi:ribosomal protein L3 glutamine methyltransferase
MNSLLDDLHTLRDWLRWAISRFNEAELSYGHGCTNAHDEAAWLILHSLHLPVDQLEPFLDARLSHEERQAVLDILQQRITRRVPAAYLTKEAWLGDFKFYVDERVIVPRSYFAELLENGFAPWIGDPEMVTDVLDLCTGSACLAIIMAHTFPHAHVDAVDISADALVVAQRNIADYGLEDVVMAHESDLFATLGGRQYDLIISNPPYVTTASMDALPSEYRHEPALALAAGEDGLEVVRRILAAAKAYLKPGGVIAIEVGHNRDLLEAAFPELEAVWLDAEGGDEKIFLLTREQL